MTAVGEAWRTIAPRRGDPHGPLPPLLLVLTVVTGLVDAVSYLSLGHVFVANMTGNVVFLGFALAGAGGLSIAASATALAAFIAGSLAGGVLSARGSHRGRLLATATAAQLLLVVVAAVVDAAAGASSAATQYALIATLGLAMGTQNATVRALAVPDMTTTVLTQTTAGIVADARWLGGPGGHAGRRVLSLGAMFAGALVGALLVVKVSREVALLVAAALVATVLATSTILSRRPAPWSDRRRPT